MPNEIKENFVYYRHDEMDLEIKHESNTGFYIEVGEKSIRCLTAKFILGCSISTKEAFDKKLERFFKKFGNKLLKK
jgi:hypothetical protein